MHFNHKRIQSFSVCHRVLISCKWPQLRSQRPLNYFTNQPQGPRRTFLCTGNISRGNEPLVSLRCDAVVKANVYWRVESSLLVEASRLKYTYLRPFCCSTSLLSGPLFTEQLCRHAQRAPRDLSPETQRRHLVATSEMREIECCRDTRVQLMSTHARPRTQLPSAVIYVKKDLVS